MQCTATCRGGNIQWNTAMHGHTPRGHWAGNSCRVRCPLPLHSLAVCCSSSIAHYPQAMWQCTATSPCLLGPRRVLVHCTISTTHLLQAMWQQNAGVAIPTAPTQCGRAWR